MKKISMSILVVAIIMITSTANAGDVLGTYKVQQVSEGISKAGNKFVRIIVDEQREINGVKYSAATQIMAFGTLIDSAKAVKPGSTMKAVVTEGEYQGRRSMVLQCILEK